MIRRPSLAQTPLRLRGARILRVFAVLVLSLFAGVGCGASAPLASGATAKRSDAGDLSARLDAIARSTHGEMGVSFRVLEGGRSYAYHGGDSFPMASVWKLPLALAVLAKVERGELALTREIELSPRDRRGGWSPLAETLQNKTRTMTLKELVDAAVVQSDNTAADVLLRLGGGPSAVTENLRRAGIRGVRVDRREAELVLDVVLPSRGGRDPDAVTPEDFERLQDETPAQDVAAAERAYATDARDTATPDAMVDLLAALEAGRMLGAEPTKALLDMLHRAGPVRMNLLLPKGTPVAHKTGTMGGSYNDVGVVTLPDGRHLALAVFVKGATVPFEVGQRAVAEASRAAYDDVLGSRPAR